MLGNIKPTANQINQPFQPKNQNKTSIEKKENKKENENENEKPSQEYNRYRLYSTNIMFAASSPMIPHRTTVQ